MEIRRFKYNEYIRGDKKNRDNTNHSQQMSYSIFFKINGNNDKSQ